MDDSMRLFILVGAINSDIQRSMKELKEVRAKSGGTLLETVGRNQKVNYLVGRINGLCDAMKQLEEAEEECRDD
jgi:hypothetical protein